MDRKKYLREWKKEQRRLNTPYAQRQRESKRSDSAKTRRKELSISDESKEKKRLYAIEYRKRPDVIAKTKARAAVKYAIFNGSLVRPSNCEICNKEDVKLRDGRSGLRADHHLGYDEENYLNVKFICVGCDSKQLRKDYD